MISTTFMDFGNFGRNPAQNDRTPAHWLESGRSGQIPASR
jgi:hypothetical protein